MPHPTPKTVAAIAQWLGPVLLPDKRGTVSIWAYYVCVVRDDRVYDRITGPAGMSKVDYKQLFEYADELEFGF